MVTFLRVQVNLLTNPTKALAYWGEHDPQNLDNLENKDNFKNLKVLKIGNWIYASMGSHISSALFEVQWTFGVSKTVEENCFDYVYVVI